MPAHVGDWLVMPPDPDGTHARRGQVIALPYLVVGVEPSDPPLFRPPGTQLQCPAPVRNRRASAS